MYVCMHVCMDGWMYACMYVAIARQLFYSKRCFAVKRYAVVMHNIWIFFGLKTAC